MSVAGNSRCTAACIAPTRAAAALPFAAAARRLLHRHACCGAATQGWRWFNRLVPTTWCAAERSGQGMACARAWLPGLLTLRRTLLTPDFLSSPWQGAVWPGRQPAGRPARRAHDRAGRGARCAAHPECCGMQCCRGWLHQCVVLCTALAALLIDRALLCVLLCVLLCARPLRRQRRVVPAGRVWLQRQLHLVRHSD